MKTNPFLTLGVLVGICSFTDMANGAVISGPIVNPNNGHSYYLLASNTWTASQAEAITLGGHLVTINDATENVWVADTFNSFGGLSRALWIGLTDVPTEGQFTWSNGDTSTFRAWSAGEPNNFGGNEHYASYWQPGLLESPGVFRDYLWNDLPNNAYPGDGLYPLPHGVVEVVPEPTVVAMSLLGLAVCLFRRMRRR
jgi:hypothetical protein